MGIDVGAYSCWRRLKSHYELSSSAEYAFDCKYMDILPVKRMGVKSACRQVLSTGEISRDCHDGAANANGHGCVITCMFFAHFCTYMTFVAYFLALRTACYFIMCMLIGKAEVLHNCTARKMVVTCVCVQANIFTATILRF